jgi:hypothetical protein
VSPGVPALLGAMLAAGAAVDAPLPTAALVVRTPPTPAPDLLAATRSRLQGRFQLLDDAAVRRVLEAFDRAPTPQELVRRALVVSAQQLRRFDTRSAGLTLHQARQDAASLPPTEEGRDLVAREAQQEALLGLLLKDVPAEERGLAVALSARPDLRPDLDEWPPVLVRSFEQVRARLSSAVKTPVTVETQPSGATVVSSEGILGSTPLAIHISAAGPTVVWLMRDGYATQCLRVGQDDPPRAWPLERLDVERRLGPLVDALRGDSLELRAQAARTLAHALGVDAVALWDAREADPIVYPAREPPAASASSLQTPAPGVRRPWYRDPLGDVLVGAAALGAGVAAAAFAAGQASALKTYAAADDSTYVNGRNATQMWRQVGTVATLSSGALLAAALVRYSWTGRGESVSAGVSVGPDGFGVVGKLALP